MSSVNRKDIARKISENTGYYIQDIEEILQAESEAIIELLKEGNTKVKNHKLYQIEVVEKKEKKAWNGLEKKYFIVPSKKTLKIKPLKELEDTIKEINNVDD